MATPTSNDINPTQNSELSDSEVHVMPEKFLLPKTGRKSKLGTWLLFGLIGVAVVGIGIAVFFWLQGQPTAPAPIVQNPNPQPINPTTTEPVSLDQKTPADRDKDRLQAVTQLQTALQRYFLQNTVYPRTLDQLVPDFISQVPLDPMTSQPYLYSGNDSSFQISFVLEEGAAWGVSILPRGKYIAKATTILPESDQPNVPPVSPSATTTPEIPPSNNPTPPTLGHDTDNDGLTDVEESIYHTSLTKTDTDGDGYTDGEEVMGAYDPLVKDKRIWQSPLMAIYRNAAYSYNVVYPKVWSTRSIDNGQEVFFTDTTTNEFFDVLVQDNPLNLSAINWYLRQNPTANVNLLTTVTVGNLPAIQTADGLVTYVSVGSKLFVISYNVGVNQPANFFATYKMFLKTIQFGPQPAGSNNASSTPATNPSTSSSTASS